VLSGLLLCVAHLAEELATAQPLVSHHLKVLRAAGLVDTDRYRYWTYYRLRPGALVRLAATLGLVARSAPAGPPAGGWFPPPTARLVSPPALLCPKEAGPCRPASSCAPRALAQAVGAIIKDVPEVLFVCVHNAGRSQMAAALLDHHAKGRVHVRSAGSDPGDKINPAAVAAMDEWGIDLSREFPKPLTDEFVQAADVVITMGCGDACPIYPGKRYEDWELDDPAGQPVEVVRRIRDDIDARVQRLLAELVPAGA
jgi:arsenate reductase